MISPKLAKAVLGGEYKKLTISDYEVIACHINIHELAHKCKEWALTHNTSITSTFRHTCGFAWVEYTVNYDGYDRFGYVRQHTYTEQLQAATEPEAIFAACDWILEHQ